MKRNTNLELYRVIVMLLILAHHFVVNSGLLNVVMQEPGRIRSMFVIFFGAWGKTGINCFVLITGFYMCKKKITLKKYLQLLLEVEFYNIVIYFIMLYMGYETFSVKSILRPVLFYGADSGRFVSAFLMFYLFIPFLNILVNNLNKGKHLFLILVCMYVYTIRGSVQGFEIGMNYVIWFSVIYIIGAYLSMYYEELPDLFINPRKNWIVLIMVLITSLLSIYIGWEKFKTTGQGLQWYYLADSNKILAVVLAVVSFLFFKSRTVKYSKIINALGGSTFGVLLIHANSDAMRKWLWSTINPVGMYSSTKIYILSFACVLAIFVICSLIELVRKQIIEKPFFYVMGDKIDGLEKRIKTLLHIA